MYILNKNGILMSVLGCFATCFWGETFTYWIWEEHHRSSECLALYGEEGSCFGCRHGGGWGVGGNGMRASEHQSAFMKGVSKTCSLRCHSTSLVLMCVGNSIHPRTGKHLLLLVSVWMTILCPPDPFTFHQIHWFHLPPFFPYWQNLVRHTAQYTNLIAFWTCMHIYVNQGNHHPGYKTSPTSQKWPCVPSESAPPTSR